MRRRSHVPRVSILALAAALTLAGPAAALEVGQKAPDFTLAAPGGKQVKLADLLGKGPVVIYTMIQAFTRPEPARSRASTARWRSSRPSAPRSWA